MKKKGQFLLNIILKTINFPSAVIWDLDGVIADTLELNFVSWQNALAEYGINISREQYRQVFGQEPRIVLEGLLGNNKNELDLSKIKKKKDAFYNLYIAGMIKTIPGVNYWLDLFSTICPQAIASASSISQIELVLDTLGIKHYFQVLVSGYGGKNKPEPDVYLIAAQELEVTPENCLVFEDSPFGIQAAKKANNTVIAICASNPPFALKDADLIIENYDILTPTNLLFFLMRQQFKKIIKKYF